MAKLKPSREEIKVRVEADYRTGMHSNYSLAQKYGIAESTIRAWAKAGSWTKDLTHKVQERIAATLSRTVQADPDAQLLEPTDEQIIQAAADAGVALVVRHRAIAQRFEAVTGRLLTVLEELADSGSVVSGVPEDPDGNPDSVMDIEAFAKTLDKASVAFERVVKIQRQAYGLDLKVEDKPKDPFESITDDQLERKIAHLMQITQSPA
jgi:transposase-like protein